MIRTEDFRHLALQEQARCSFQTAMGMFVAR
jgi:hypothetical protein